MNILLVAGMAAIWMLFAPVKLGGQVSYVLVDGISMLPNFHTGDLVLVRQASAYQVGDVVIYHDPLMNADIIHRIIGQQGDHFVLKGDNNTWDDATLPTSADILGKLWIHLPKFGTAVLWLQEPVHMALAAGLIGGLFMVNLTVQKPNKRGKRKNKPAVDPSGFEMALILAGILALAFLALAIFAFTRPVMRVADKIPYKQTGVFSYSAAGAPGVYDTSSARSGEPVFTKLTCTLNLGFAYSLQGEGLSAISGTQKFHAQLVDQQSGWKRTIPLTTATKFTGNSFTSKTTIDLCQIQALLDSVTQKTGFRLSSNSLLIVADISVGGEITGQKFTDTFEPQLAFDFDSLHFSLSGNTSGSDPMQTVQPGSFTSSSLVENTIPVFGVNPTIRGMRLVSEIGLGISLLGLLALGCYYYFATRGSEESIIRMKYAALLVGVREPGLESLSPVIDVNSMDDLARLAERQNAMIMHLTHADVHYYLVQVEGTTYRYMTDKRQE
ncbi:MAG: signal peptidase I [Anaerolineales bacterium]